MSNSDAMKISLLSVLSLSILAISCVERINLKLDTGTERLVVDGSMSTDTIAHTVRLTKSTGYFYNEPAPPVTGAQVSISDGAEVWDLKEDSPGVYRTDSSVFGVAGVTYTLDIKLAAPVGGYINYSASSKLFPVTHLDSVSVAHHPDWGDKGVWEVKCFVQDPPSKDYYRFLISKNGKMVTDTLYEWFVTDDRLFNGNYIYGAPIAYLRGDKPDEVLKAGDTVKVEMNSITKEYFSFISDAQSEIRGTIPLFSGPPANVIGNITNGAIGFFASYSVSRASVVVADSLVR